MAVQAVKRSLHGLYMLFFFVALGMLLLLLFVVVGSCWFLFLLVIVVLVVVVVFLFISYMPCDAFFFFQGLALFASMMFYAEQSNEKFDNVNELWFYSDTNATRYLCCICGLLYPYYLFLSFLHYSSLLCANVLSFFGMQSFPKHS